MGDLFEPLPVMVEDAMTELVELNGRTGTGRDLITVLCASTDAGPGPSPDSRSRRLIAWESSR